MGSGSFLNGPPNEIQQELELIVVGRPLPADIDPLPKCWPPGEWLYRGIEDSFCSTAGRFLRPQAQGNHADGRPAMFRQCLSARAGRGLIYVEGFAVNSFLFPFPHGWCVTGRASLWTDLGHGWEYFGIPFDMDFVIATRRAIKTDSMIDNPSRGFPLLRSRSQDWRSKGKIGKGA